MKYFFASYAYNRNIDTKTEFDNLTFGIGTGNFVVSLVQDQIKEKTKYNRVIILSWQEISAREYWYSGEKDLGNSERDVSN
jgi:uncharacterized membrane protein